MRKLIVQHWTSLDGFAADNEGKLDFFIQTIRPIYQGDYENFLDSIDCILFGRSTYALFSSTWPDRPIEEDFLATKINTTPKIVFSKSLTQAPWGKYQPATVDSSDPILSIKKLKSAEGKNIILWGSVSITQLAMRENLIDEYHLIICPTLTGGGKRLMPALPNPLPLTLLNSKQYDNGTVLLRYRVQ